MKKTQTGKSPNVCTLPGNIRIQNTEMKSVKNKKNMLKTTEKSSCGKQLHKRQNITKWNIKKKKKQSE